MKIWLVHHGGEPTPSDKQQMRLRRMGMLAEAAIQRGHEVVWWNSTFLHINKTQRFDTSCTIDYSPQLRLNYLHARPYEKNISLTRIRNHQDLGRNFAKLARQEPKPDVILCSYPVPELCDEAVRYSRETNTPVALDVRDIWPHAMLDMMPASAQPFARVALSPYYRMARRVFRDATSICGITQEFMEWGLAQGRRKKSDSDRVFSFGYQPLDLDSAQQSDASKFWASQGVGVDPSVPVLCFFGLVNHQFDFKPVFEAVQRLQKNKRVQLVICGKGESIEQFRQQMSGNPDILFPGWVNAEQIWELMQLSSYGLAPYVDSPSFRGSIGNKPIEYLAGGLPILCSLSEGPLYRLAETEQCGFAYQGCAKMLETKLAALLASPDSHRALVGNARSVFADRYEASRVYGGMVRHLEDIASCGRSGYSSAVA
ncbi:glycosyltransferase family 4 protein [Adhaeretor mobilis]|uniref:Putative glycosyl transferase n=1 Tax=Adhaeretor mobilis TaxID=1930276 RepID=A0A517MY59_9BACT|nr:glycosyltransferase family 4 protein [Adhaeretor mobilis]QDS99803.1 putative glycosyl transferase [Adhaeretor mobilis]